MRSDMIRTQHHVAFEYASVARGQLPVTRGTPETLEMEHKVARAPHPVGRLQRVVTARALRAVAAGILHRQ